MAVPRLRLGIAGMIERYVPANLAGVRITGPEDVERFARVVGGGQMEEGHSLAAELGLTPEPDMPSSFQRAGDELRLNHSDIYWDGVAHVQSAGVQEKERRAAHQVDAVEVLPAAADRGGLLLGIEPPDELVHHRLLELGGVAAH